MKNAPLRLTACVITCPCVTVSIEAPEKKIDQNKMIKPKNENLELKLNEKNSYKSLLTSTQMKRLHKPICKIIKQL